MATAWAQEIFREFRLQGKGKQSPFTAILRKSRQQEKNAFLPQELEGAKFICTTHWIDIIVNGLPEGTFKTMNSNGGVMRRVGVEKQGFLGLRGGLQWRWEDLRRVKDVVITSNDITDKVRKIRAKLGTRVVTCKQAADLANMIPLDDAEYKHNFGDSVIVLKANRKGECVPHPGKVKVSCRV